MGSCESKPIGYLDRDGVTRSMSSYDKEALAKFSLIEEFSDPNGIFIETGTAGGTTSQHAAGFFSHVYTIELDFGFYDQAVQRFFDNDKVTPVYGDSAIMLGSILYKLKGPATILLDAHFVGSGAMGESGHTPVVEELKAIFPNGGSIYPHIVLIDDARLFSSDPAYPTMTWVSGFADTINYDMITKDDIIRLTPRRDS